MPTIGFAPLDLATRAPFGISRWSHSEFADFVVTMTDDDGLTGFGEGAPNARYQESRDDDAAALEELAGALEAVDGVAAVEAFCAAQRGFPALRGALSAAAWDLAGKQSGEPVWQLLGLERASVRTSLTIPIGDPATHAGPGSRGRRLRHPQGQARLRRRPRRRRPAGARAADRRFRYGRQ